MILLIIKKQDNAYILLNSYDKKNYVIIDEKINIWKDKIIELIYNFTIFEIKYSTTDKCKEIINFIEDIINEFITQPNTMIEYIPKSYNSKKKYL